MTLGLYASPSTYNIICCMSMVKHINLVSFKKYLSSFKNSTSHDFLIHAEVMFGFYLTITLPILNDNIDRVILVFAFVSKALLSSAMQGA